MCILGLSLGSSSIAPFIAVHSRDEYMSRPTDGLQCDADGILLSRDLRSGGTWLGLNTRTRVYASLTNVRDKKSPPNPAAAPSRGMLVISVLRGSALQPQNLASLCDASATGEATVELDGDYAGFNLVVAALDSLPAIVIVISNRINGVPTGRAQVIARRVDPGIHAVSNSFLDDESWGKVAWVRQHLQSTLPSWCSANDATIVDSTGTPATDVSDRSEMIAFCGLLSSISSIM